VDIEFSIWLGTTTRWAHLIKVIDMPVVPRVGEFMKFQNAVVGDYFAFRISEVTHREGGRIEVCAELLNNIDNRIYSFEEEAEFDEYFTSYLAEGWQCPRGVGPNRRLAGAGPQSHHGAQHDVGPDGRSPSAPARRSTP
jgi:hypothetical protein